MGNRINYHMVFGYCVFGGGFSIPNLSLVHRYKQHAFIVFVNFSLDINTLLTGNSKGPKNVVVCFKRSRGLCDEKQCVKHIGYSDSHSVRKAVSVLRWFVVSKATKVKTEKRNQLQGGKESGTHYKKNKNINKAIVRPSLSFLCVCVCSIHC